MGCTDRPGCQAGEGTKTMAESGSEPKTDTKPQRSTRDLLRIALTRSRALTEALEELGIRIVVERGLPPEALKIGWRDGGPYSEGDLAALAEKVSGELDALGPRALPLFGGECVDLGCSARRFHPAHTEAERPGPGDPPQGDRPVRLTDVREAVELVIERHSTDAAESILREFGATKIAELKPNQFAECIERCRAWALEHQQPPTA